MIDLLVLSGTTLWAMSVSCNIWFGWRAYKRRLWLQQVIAREKARQEEIDSYNAVLKALPRDLNHGA